MMTINASFDHRVIDGAVGAAFLKQVKELLEDPALLCY
jgi:pyruvate/2-oxoglutarate dehydrogenase complex dihydrolipoamide acyltransferase (E2) component